LHLIAQNCVQDVPSHASVLIHEGVTKIFDELLASLRQIQNDIQQKGFLGSQGAQEGRAGDLRSEFSAFSWEDYSFGEEGRDREGRSGTLGLDTASRRYAPSIRSTGSLKTSTKGKISALGFFARHTDTLGTSPPMDEVSLGGSSVEMRASVLLDNLVLLMENYHFLSVRLGGNTFGTFFSPQMLIQLRRHYEKYLDVFCHAMVRLSFPKLFHVLHLAKSTSSDKNVLMKQIQTGGTLKDHKKTLALVSKKTMRLLSKETGLFPIVWHQFEMTFTKFVIQDLFVALENLNDPKLTLPYAADDIKNIFSDIPLQL
jgi:hypothetical protein